MNKIVIICGFSASGKDSLTKYIADHFNYNMTISHTSRPIRPKESEGDPYYFISKEQFETMINNGEFIECREYHTLVNNIPAVWYYGVHKDEVDLSQYSYIVVLDIRGLRAYKEHFGEDKIISFFIEVDEETRKQRCVGRADFDLTEWNRRLEDDKALFTDEVIKQEVDFVVENYNFEQCINKILDKIGEIK